MTLVFDQPHYEELNLSRAEVLRPVVAELRRSLPLRTAADVGCGLGYFSALLHEMGFATTGFDGRAQNADACRQRHAGVEFRVADLEDVSIAAGGRFDLVVCLGLLYHLENPFRGIRNLEKLAVHALVLESMCVPSPAPVMDLRDEWHGDDQGLHYVAFYASEACLIKMLYRAGFAAVYRFVHMPDHDHFREMLSSHRVRTMLVGTRAPIRTPLLASVPEPTNSPDPWVKPLARVAGINRRIARWLGKLSPNGRRDLAGKGEG